MDKNDFLKLAMAFLHYQTKASPTLQFYCAAYKNELCIQSEPTLKNRTYQVALWEGSSVFGAWSPLMRRRHYGLPSTL